MGNVNVVQNVKMDLENVTKPFVRLVKKEHV
jgi:hypothetical protein